MDLRGAIRKVWVDHVNLLTLLTVESVPVEQPAAQFVAARLRLNPIEFRQLLEPVLGVEVALNLERLLAEHIELGAALLVPIRNRDQASADAAVARFAENGERLAAALAAVNPDKLDITTARALIQQHNQFDVDGAVLRAQGRFREQVELYDPVMRHTLLLADVIYESLTP